MLDIKAKLQQLTADTELTPEQANIMQEIIGEGERLAGIVRDQSQWMRDHITGGKPQPEADAPPEPPKAPTFAEAMKSIFD